MCLIVKDVEETSTSKSHNCLTTSHIKRSADRTFIASILCCPVMNSIICCETETTYDTHIKHVATYIITKNISHGFWVFKESLVGTVDLVSLMDLPSRRRSDGMPLINFSDGLWLSIQRQSWVTLLMHTMSPCFVCMEVEEKDSVLAAAAEKIWPCALTATWTDLSEHFSFCRRGWRSCSWANVCRNNTKEEHCMVNSCCVLTVSCWS